jgi:hypothetical protein
LINNINDIQALPDRRYFWQAVKSFDIEWQKRLLAFITGSDRIPATGIVNMPFKLSFHPETSATALKR